MERRRLATSREARMLSSGSPGKPMMNGKIGSEHSRGRAHHRGRGSRDHPRLGPSHPRTPRPIFRQLAVNSDAPPENTAACLIFRRALAAFSGEIWRGGPPPRESVHRRLQFQCRSRSKRTCNASSSSAPMPARAASRSASSSISNA